MRLASVEVVLAAVHLDQQLQLLDLAVAPYQDRLSEPEISLRLLARDRLQEQVLAQESVLADLSLDQLVEH